MGKVDAVKFIKMAILLYFCHCCVLYRLQKENGYSYTFPDKIEISLSCHRLIHSILNELVVGVVSRFTTTWSVTQTWTRNILLLLCVIVLYLNLLVV